MQQKTGQRDELKNKVEGLTGTEFYFGPKFGFNVASISDGLNKSKFSFHLGAFAEFKFSQNRNIQIIHAGPCLHTPGLSFISLTRIDQLRLQTEKIIKFSGMKKFLLVVLAMVMLGSVQAQTSFKNKVEGMN